MQKNELKQYYERSICKLDELKRQKEQELMKIDTSVDIVCKRAGVFIKQMWERFEKVALDIIENCQLNKDNTCKESISDTVKQIFLDVEKAMKKEAMILSENIQKEIEHNLRLEAVRFQFLFYEIIRGAEQIQAKMLTESRIKKGIYVENWISALSGMFGWYKEWFERIQNSSENTAYNEIRKDEVLCTGIGLSGEWTASLSIGFIEIISINPSIDDLKKIKKSKLRDELKRYFMVSFDDMKKKDEILKELIVCQVNKGFNALKTKIDKESNAIIIDMRDFLHSLIESTDI